MNIIITMVEWHEDVSVADKHVQVMVFMIGWVLMFLSGLAIV